MKPFEWTDGKLVAVCVTLVLLALITAGTVVMINQANNSHALKESEQRDELRKAEVEAAVEAKKIKASQAAHKEEIRSKKRKVWERETKD